MFSSDAILGFFFISLICIGLMGNLVLFTLYIDTFLTQSCLKKPIDVIFIHLTLVNVLTILFKLIPDVMPSFGERYFLDDVGCKTTLYIYRVTRVFPSVRPLSWVCSKLSPSILLILSGHGLDLNSLCALEGMMLKLKLQYYGHLMGRVDSVEKTHGFLLTDL